MARLRSDRFKIDPIWFFILFLNFIKTFFNQNNTSVIIIIKLNRKPYFQFIIVTARALLPYLLSQASFFKLCIIICVCKVYSVILQFLKFNEMLSNYYFIFVLLLLFRFCRFTAYKTIEMLLYCSSHRYYYF